MLDLLEALKTRGPTLQMLMLLELMTSEQRMYFCYPDPGRAPTDRSPSEIVECLMGRLIGGSVVNVAAELEMAATGRLDESRLNHPYYRRDMLRVAAYFGHSEAVMSIVQHPGIQQDEVDELMSVGISYTRLPNLRKDLLKLGAQRMLSQMTLEETQQYLQLIDQHAERIISMCVLNQ